MPGFSFTLGRRKTTTAKVHPAPRKSKSPVKINREMAANIAMYTGKGGKTRRRNRTRRRR